MIKDTRTAYKIGYSCALNPKTISVYAELARWKLSTVRDKKIASRFISGYGSGTRISQETGITRVEYNFLEPAHAALFS